MDFATAIMSVIAITVPTKYTVFAKSQGLHVARAKSTRNHLSLHQILSKMFGTFPLFPFTDSHSQLQLLLFSSERALAQSHGFKSQASKPDHPPSTRRDQLSWLRRSLQYSTQLYTISAISSKSAPPRLNQQTLTEISIYHLSILSELQFERQEYAESLTSLSTRRLLLTTISNSSKGSYDQALALEFIDAYDPLIRFCAYKLGRSESHNIEGVVGDVDLEMMEEALPGVQGLLEGLKVEIGAEEVEKGRKELDDVKFAGERVELRSAEIVAVMLKVQEALWRLKAKEGKGSMKGWDRVLSVLGEAEGVAKRLLDDHEVSHRYLLP
jgi:signal recognition particle subunit SRP68